MTKLKPIGPLFTTNNLHKLSLEQLDECVIEHLSHYETRRMPGGERPHTGYYAEITYNGHTVFNSTVMFEGYGLDYPSQEEIKKVSRLALRAARRVAKRIYYEPSKRNLMEIIKSIEATIDSSEVCDCHYLDINVESIKSQLDRLSEIAKTIKVKGT